jgi:hypothetical protein
MKRTAGAMVLLAALGGCVTTEQGPSPGFGCGNCGGWGSRAPNVPGIQGPWGQPVTMAAPYLAAPPTGSEAARAMMARSVPMDLVQAAASSRPGAPSDILLAGGPGAPQGGVTPPGVPYQPIMLAGGPPAGAVAGVGAMTGPSSGGSSSGAFQSKRTEVRFVAPSGMKVSWFGPTPDGRAGFAASQINTPGRYNFVQAAV